MISETVVTPASAPALSLDEAKLHLRVDGSDEDAYIAGLVGAATNSAEHFLSRALITQTRKASFDRFPSCGGVLELPTVIDSVAVAITYLDTDGATQTLATTEYYVDRQSRPARIVPALGKSWPLAACLPGAVRVQYTCGYGNADAIPACIKQGMKLLVGHMYENREEVVVGNIVTELPKASEWLMWPERIFRIV